MKTTLRKNTEIVRKRYEIDAQDFVLGRLSTKVAKLLCGKHKIDYTPHIDMGDFVVVKNAPKIKFTGRKIDQKKYTRYSGYPGGITTTPLKTMLEKKPEFVISEAVRGMLPKTRLQKHQMRRLTVLRDHKHDLKIDGKITK